jgi:pyruvate dehydrogenase E2 component (dihydrolipoyllysine-residue acetyltransferase)
MPYLLFPSPGNGVSTATLIRWLTLRGDIFAAGDELAEFETESGYLIVEAATSGRLVEQLVQPGQTLADGAKLARIENAESSLEAEANSVRNEKAKPETHATRIRKVIPILMPQAGNTMEEGTVLSWRVKEGDQIAAGQLICEIETDKATMDFESPDAGRLARIVAKVGEPVAVKNVIALLADSDADADSYLGNQVQSGATTNSVPVVAAANGPNRNRSAGPAPVTAEGRVKASPAARRMATERGIALDAIGSGSGPGGRILSTDLRNTEPASVSTSPTVGVGEIRRPLSKMRRAIGLNLQQSKQTVPHFYVRTTIDADPLLAFYRERKTSANCTLNDLIVLAVGRAIRDFPAVRSQVIGNEIVEYPHANIGVAVGVDDGLVVPVVLDVDTLSLSQLAAETRRVVELARKGRLENVGKGHFTISNLGMFGVEEFSAIINPPESGILALSAVREAVLAKNGSMRVGHQMTMTLSADHRIVDGVMAAKFMQRLTAILEHPGDELT